MALGLPAKIGIGTLIAASSVVSALGIYKAVTDYEFFGETAHSQMSTCKEMWDKYRNEHSQETIDKSEDEKWCETHYVRK